MAALLSPPVNVPNVKPTKRSRRRVFALGIFAGRWSFALEISWRHLEIGFCHSGKRWMLSVGRVSDRV